MSSESTPIHGGSFIVRIWWEPGSDGAQRGHWRGWVQHVRQGTHIYFTSLHDLNLFIEHELGIEHTPHETPQGLV